MSNIIPFRSEAEVSDSQAIAQLEATRTLSLMELAKQKREITTAIREAGGEITGDLEDLFEQANNLLAGKIDRVAVFVKEVIPAHIEACKKQIKTLQLLEERIKEYTLDAIKMSGEGETRIEGLAWRARMQQNPPSIIVENEEAVPVLFKRVRVTIEDVFDASDVDRRAFWEDLIRQKAPRTGEVALEANRDDLKAALFTKDDEGRTVRTDTRIDGVVVSQEYHVRFEAGRAKASKSPTKRPKKVEETNE